MSAITRPRGPLPTRIYWVRRLLVLGLAVLLVVVLARLLGGGGDGGSAQSGVAQQAAGTPTEAGAPSPSGSPEATGDPSPDASQEAADDPSAGAGDDEAAEDGKQTEKDKQAEKGKREKLPEPEGRCDPEDLVVEPVVKKPVAGSPVRIVLEISTREAEACNFTASRESMIVDITSGDDEIWTSRHCAGRIGKNEVVPRREEPARVAMAWSGKRSDEECSRTTRWALPGWYHVRAAAYSGEPTDVQFQLEKPERPVVKKTVPPKKKQQQGNG